MVVMSMMQMTIPKLALFSVSCIQANHRQLPPHVCHQYLLPENVAPGSLSLSQSVKCKQSDDDLYIMMRCLCVTKNEHFPLPSRALEARSETPGFGLVMMMMMMMMIMITGWIRQSGSLIGIANDATQSRRKSQRKSSQCKICCADVPVTKSIQETVN